MHFQIFFKTSFSVPNGNHNITLSPLCTPTFLIIHPQDIITKILSLNSNKSSGGDPIPVNILKLIVNEISTPLCTLFNKILSTGEYPLHWKNANVTPVHKKGNKSSISNYRPISILPVFSKLFDSFIYESLFDEIKYFLPESQHGFLPKKSTVTNLTEYSHHLVNNIKLKSQTDSIYLDFAKAFDRVPHNLLIKKLKMMGVNNNLLILLKNYLSNRFQTVQISGQKSNKERVLSGTIQGSLLGSLLFIAYIWDLSLCVQFSQCSLYADDSKIFRIINNISDCVLLQNDLNNILNWCNE
jgi:Reverse transcriptase (RNA-dependent DNA polymerase)